ncbi:MAG TPA: hypothetical protein VK676_07090, partial [Steroidobacteraceae bacterium]|nr:hypothetical protein [Steroidobacteraceae bacterium]
SQVPVAAIRGRDFRNRRRLGAPLRLERELLVLGTRLIETHPEYSGRARQSPQGCIQILRRSVYAKAAAP